MKRLELTVASLIGGLFLVAASPPSALADTNYTYDYTYVFTANPGQVTGYNGSTIEINESPGPGRPFPSPWFSVVSIDMRAVIEMGAWSGGNGYGPAPASSTPCSFSVPSFELPVPYSGDCDIGYANSFGWDGWMAGGWAGSTPFGCPTLDYYLTSSGLMLAIEGPGDGQPYIDTPASGTWSLDVPDAGSSFELLAAAMAALGAGRLLLRGRKN
jgi:hypothetical protein